MPLINETKLIVYLLIFTVYNSDKYNNKLILFTKILRPWLDIVLSEFEEV